jgi:hypothetical protein
VYSQKVRDSFSAEFSELLADHFCHFWVVLGRVVISLVVFADIVVDGVDDEVILPF